MFGTNRIRREGRRKEDKFLPPILYSELLMSYCIVVTLVHFIRVKILLTNTYLPCIPSTVKHFWYTCTSKVFISAGCLYYFWKLTVPLLLRHLLCTLRLMHCWFDQLHFSDIEAGGEGEWAVKEREGKERAAAMSKFWLRGKILQERGGRQCCHTESGYNFDGGARKEKLAKIRPQAKFVRTNDDLDVLKEYIYLYNVYVV